MPESPGIVSMLPPGIPVVEFRNVRITFDRAPVLKDVSFRIMPGETLILLGPAGGGKSVLMKLANGLLQPDVGSVHIFGRDLATLSGAEIFNLRKHIGMVFQESALFDSLSVDDNVGYQLHEEHVPEAEIATRVREALKFVDLERALGKFPAELSGGMRRRVSIARAIITGPELLLYDSPTGGLDPITSTTIIELVVKQRDVSHATALLITHRLQDAFTLATHRFSQATGQMEPIPPNEEDAGIDPSTRFLILNEGEVVFDGNTRELTGSNDPWICSYLS